MPSIEDNLKTWDEVYDWSARGEEWSASWGGPSSQWKWTIFPRISSLVPVSTILEIAPGAGRWTHYLRGLCENLIIVDLSKRCIEMCKARFSDSRNITYYVNDGTSLNMVKDHSIDFVFSFDSLVHADAKVMQAYLLELSTKLKRDGIGLIHHSNLGACWNYFQRFAELSEQEREWLGLKDDWRARDMTAALFEEYAADVELPCISQEIINWSNHHFTDCISIFAPKASKWARLNVVQHNQGMQDEMRHAARLSKLYDLNSEQAQIGPRPITDRNAKGAAPREVLVGAGSSQELDEVIAQKDAQIAALQSSRSWRITAPLRKLNAVLSTLVGRSSDLHGQISAETRRHIPQELVAISMPEEDKGDVERSLLTSRLIEHCHDKPLSEIFLNCSDDLWFWAHTKGISFNEDLISLLPTLPSIDIQMNTTGRQGVEALDQAFKAYQLFKQVSAEHGVTIGEKSVVLDFGCGWGRISRFFLKEVVPENLYGADINEEMIEICRHSNLRHKFLVNQPFPPIDLPNDFLDMIYTFSVFSHLSEPCCLAWLEEFRRILKPGGVLLATTRTREFISMCEEYHEKQDLEDHLKGLAVAFLNPGEALASYDDGAFVFSPTGGGGVFDAEFFGESAIPEAYVRNVWPRYFSSVDFVPDVIHTQFDQNLLIAKK